MEFTKEQLKVLKRVLEERELDEQEEAIATDIWLAIVFELMYGVKP